MIGTLAFLVAAGPAAAQVAPFSNDTASCNRYGPWAVQVIQRASAAGCNVLANKEILDPAVHWNWCNRQSLAVMSTAHLVHAKGVAFRCAKQGVDVK